MSSFTSPIEAIRLRDGAHRTLPAAARRSCIMFAVVALFATTLMLMLPQSFAAPARDRTAAVAGGHARAMAEQPVLLLEMR